MHATQSFETLGTTNLTTLLNIPEAFKFQQQHCEKLKSTCLLFLSVDDMAATMTLQQGKQKNS